MPTYEYHEAANIFPMMEGDSFDELVADIKTNGLHEDIELLDGKILDGRNRHSACTMAGIKPRFKTVTTDDPVAYVLSKNLHRRHLTPSQASMVAARARDYYDRQAKERMSAGGKRHGQGVENLPPLEPAKSRDKAGKAAGVSGKTVDHATKVLKQGVPELIKAVDEGRMAVSTAAILASESPEVQRAEATAPKRNRRYAPEKNGASNGKPSHSPTKTKSIRTERLEAILSRIDEVVVLLDRPSLQVSIAHVKIGVNDIRKLVSELLSQR